MAEKIVTNPLSPLLISICAQLRQPGNVVGPLGEQAAAAIESLWRDNVTLTRFALETEVRIKETMAFSAETNRFRTLK